MRYAKSDKLEIIRPGRGGAFVSPSNTRQTGEPRTHSTVVRTGILQRGAAGLHDQSPKPKHVWNRIPDEVRRKIVKPGIEGDGLVSARIGRDLYRQGNLLCLRGLSLSCFKSAHLITKSGLYCDQGCRRNSKIKPRRSTSFGNRLTISRFWLGMVLSQHGLG